MRLIPGKTKVKIELFKGITLGDVIVGGVTLALIALISLSTFKFKIPIVAITFVIGGILVFRLDEDPTYVLVIHWLRYLSYPRRYWRFLSDAHLLSKGQGATPGELLEEYFPKEEGEKDPFADLSPSERKKAEKELFKEENKILKSKTATDEEKNAVWIARAKRSAFKKKQKEDAKDEAHEEFIEDVMPFTGIADGCIEYNGKYYGAVIEIDPVEFRFFSEFRRNAAIEECFGKVLRSLREEYAFNIVKIERPMIYDKYLDKEYNKLDDLKKSYENGLLSEKELKARVEVQYDRINALRDICFDNKVIQPFYYVVLYNSDKRQLQVEVGNAIQSFTQGELTVRRLTDDKELAIFLKYTNTLDFEERDIDKIKPEDYVAWAMPESVKISTRTAVINKIVTHQLRVATFPTVVGDAWLAGVMSIPGTKVVVKATPMDRSKAIRSIDRSLSELRGQYNATTLDSKMLELEEHIETLSALLVTLQQDNENLLTVNIYISVYDSVKTAEGTDSEYVKSSYLPVIADMKKIVRRSWQESGMRLNPMDFDQMQAFIGSQVSAYDPCLKEGRGIPANTIAAMYPWIYANISDPGGIRMGETDGVPVFIDFFRRDSERINSNMVIIGKSGSGKSYGTKSLLVNMASEDAKIFILDPENEYTELAHNLDGKIINVGNAQQGRLNPFHIITALEDDEEGDESSGDSYSTHLQFLEEFFKQILPDIDSEALEYLNTLVERTYTNKGITLETDLSALKPSDYPIFDDLYDVVLEEFQRTNNEYLRTMLQTLMNYVSKFATGGRNSNIWNGPSSVTTDENFTVFNFQSLLSNRNQTVANAQMLLVLKYIDNEIIKNREYNRKYGLNRRIVVVIDEAHVFIDAKYPVALDFMFQLAKRIRKYNGMQIVITQNIKDFVGSEEIARKSTAIINACQYSFIFALSPNDMDDLVKLYDKAGGINDIEQEQIMTAPRGQAFTILSPSSRSSFMVSVPQPMVDMFEQPEYTSRYFTGEGGEENWESFVKDSRLLHEQNFVERKMASEVEDITATQKKSNLHFEEISVEEADKMVGLEEEKPPVKSALEEYAGISFEEINVEEPVQNEEPKAPQSVAQPAFTPMDMASILEMVRSEVRREMELAQLKQAAQTAPTVPVTPAAEVPPMPVPFVVPQPEEQEEALVEETAAEPEEMPMEETAAEPEEAPAFDIMALLNEQLENYNKMNMREQMEELEVMTMDITLEDLVAYTRETRQQG